MAPEETADVVTVQVLTSDCGHHCGVATSTDVRTIGHCGCPECHAGPVPPIVSTKVGR